MSRVASLLVVAVAQLATPALASARADPPSRAAQRAAVIAVLEAPHPKIDAAGLQRIGPDVHAILIEHATSAQVAAPVRARALGLLRHFPNAASRAVLIDALRAPNASDAVLHVALAALAVGWGVDVLPVLRDHLLDKRATVREAAAHALGEVADRRAHDLLDSRLPREPSLAVRDAIVAAIQRHASRR